MINLNTNMPSLTAQRSLTNSTYLLNQAIERMSTGFKINHASDNAANYSISTNMSTKIGAYQVAEDNVTSGLDLLSTASGSLDLISDKLSRLRALAEQASNGTYGERSLKSINTEANAIVDEMERIYSTAEYNGIKLFGASCGGFMQEVNQRDTSSMTKLSGVDPTTAISSGTYSISTAEELAKLAEMTNTGKVTGGEFVLANNIDLSAYSSGEGWTPIGVYTGSYDKAFRGTFDGNGYVVSNLYINRSEVDDSDQGLFGLVDNGSIKNLGVKNCNVRDVGELAFVGGLVGEAFNSTFTNCYATGSVTGQLAGGLAGSVYENVTLTNCYATGSVTGNDDAGGLVGDVGESTLTNCYATGSITGVYAGGLVGDADKKLTITDSYYDKDKTGQSDTGKGVGLTTAEFTEKLSNITLPSFTLNMIYTPNETTFQVGIDSDSFSSISLDTGFGLNVDFLRCIGLGVDCLEQIDNTLDMISAKQIEFGSVQNRLESALEEISTQYDNLVSSRSTLRDADVAEVSSKYIRQQILQQASATLMATANQTPSLALQLL